MTQQLSALPDPGDIPTPNERARIVATRQLLLARRNHLTMLVHAVTSLPPTQPLAEWKSILESAIADFEKELAALEDSQPSDPRPVEKREAQVREALRILNNGPQTFPQGEFLPDA